LSPLADVSDGGFAEMPFPPRLGEHNEAIYSGALGMTRARIAELKERGII
jgi:crotonobetainyl-CoA:carnitine CoA-transferase CaiB-like acyl-CoA transferase